MSKLGTTASIARRVAKAVMPPVVVHAGRALLKRKGPREWEYVGRSWPHDPPAGWDVESVVRTQLDRWPGFVSGVAEPNPFLQIAGLGSQPSTDADQRFHNTVMTFAYVLARTARGRDRISILDWGGGLGQYAVLARSLLPSVAIEYACRELPRLAAAGRTVLQDDAFYDSDEPLAGRTFDLVLASSSLQYAPDWRACLGTLARCTGGYLFITRLPVIFRSPSFVVVQRPHRYGYDTEYVGWFLNRTELLDAARACGLRLAREFLIMEHYQADGAPEDADSRGYLFTPSREEES